MSAFSDSVIKHYADAGSGPVKRLGRALGECEAATAAAAGPSAATAKGTDHMDAKAQASEAVRPGVARVAASELVRVTLAAHEDAAADAMLAAAPLRSDRVFDAVMKHIQLAEGVSYSEARQLAGKRFPKACGRYLLQED